MSYEAAVSFFEKLMNNYRLQTIRFRPDETPEIDLGLRRMLGLETFPLKTLDQSRERVIYTMCDRFMCTFTGLVLPCGELLLVGPYLTQEISDTAIAALLDAQNLPGHFLPTLRQYYATIPFLSQTSMFQSILNTLGECLWGSQSAFTTEYIESGVLAKLSEEAMEALDPPTEAADIKLLENRYEGERRLMYAVAHGQLHQAQLFISHMHEGLLEKRAADPLRNLRNYGIVLNTLLRKAAEHGSVHPVHIDRLSSAMARKLENARSVSEALALYNAMVHKYCLLVKNHSMKQFSLLVQHVILRIETDLTADLSLKAHADHLNVNASYLSTLFKKETGVTLTEYVNHARIDHAIFLLNVTDMQIQTIAQYCGIPDVNYFTKLFKRTIGKTPKEYRQDTRRMVAQR